jgi:DNA-binding MarR family transcriptional regulator
MSDSTSASKSNSPGEESGGFMPVESFQNVPSVLLKDLGRRNDQNKNILEHLDIAVYALLKAHARFKGDCFPSLERLAILAACSVSTIQRSLKRLEKAEHIQRKSNLNGKIFLLTDVTKAGKVARRNRISFPAPALKPRLNTPPKVQEIVGVAGSQEFDGEGEWSPDDEPPF